VNITVRTDGQIDGSAKLKQQVEAVVEGALSRFGDRVTSVEVHFADDDSRHKSGHNDKRCVMEVRLAGIPPIAASHQGSSLDQALEGVADKMGKMLNRTLGRQRALSRRRSRQPADLTAVDPHLQREAEAGNQDEFKEVLRPLLGNLAHHARREIRILQADGTLYPGQAVLAELLDEAITRAWLQFADRPRWMALDLWLTKILDETLEELVHQDEQLELSLRNHLHDSPRNAPQVDEREWWDCLLGAGQAPLDDDATPARSADRTNIQLEAEELVYRIQRLLGALPKAERQAFVMNVLEAYDLTEIAKLQGRAEFDVRTDIESAREQLREQLCADSPRQASADDAAALLAADSTVQA
jgi:RNA polymerase sigma factor (sigma-70 family)